MNKKLCHAFFISFIIQLVIFPVAYENTGSAYVSFFSCSIIFALNFFALAEVAKQNNKA